MKTELKTDLALLLARRQKRLAFWQKQMTLEPPGGEQADKLIEFYSTYLLLLARLARTAGDAQSSECEERLKNIERELSSLFEARRLMTSPLGAPAIR